MDHAGQSIGTGTAVELAARMCDQGQPPALLVLITPFASLRQLAMDITWAGILLLDRYRSKERIRSVSCPTWMAHGPGDNVIPFHHAQELIRCSPARERELYVMEDATHCHFPWDLPARLGRFLRSSTSNTAADLALGPVAALWFQPSSNLVERHQCQQARAQRLDSTLSGLASCATVSQRAVGTLGDLVSASFKATATVFGRQENGD
jgi:hypothetical protein